MNVVRRITLRLVAGAMFMAASVLACRAESSPAYNFLNIASSTTSYGLGGINISEINDDVNNIDMNPAFLGPEYEKVLGINYMHYIAGSNFAGVKFANGIGDNSAWGLGLQYFGYGSMKWADEGGNILGDFSPKDLALSLYYAHDITDRWRGGVALKFLYSAYDSYTAIALATDIGVNYYDPEQEFSMSLVGANLGGQLKRFTGSYDRLPVDVRLGFTKGFGLIQCTVTLWNMTRWHLPYYDAGDGTTDAQPELKDTFGANLMRHVILAADYVPSDRFHLGIGYNYKTRTDMATYQRNFLSGFSLSMGINVNRFGFGIALAQPHAGATTIMLNISSLIGEFIR